jgi:hypothetical protein
VTDPKLVRREDLVVALDYGQFYLHTADNDPDLAVALLEQAQDAAGIAQADGLLVVESPHQNNFEMPLGVEIWDARPADYLAGWEEAFEAHLEVREGGLTYESPTVELTDIEVSPGSYHALITGRGFVSRGRVRRSRAISGELGFGPAIRRCRLGDSNAGQSVLLLRMCRTLGQRVVAQSDARGECLTWLRREDAPTLDTTARRRVWVDGTPLRSPDG